MIDLAQILENYFRWGLINGTEVTSADFELFPQVLEKWHQAHPGSFERVVFGFGILLENCCDPDLSYLDWRPDIRAFLESQQEGGCVR